jgi:hypothetical protein
VIGFLGNANLVFAVGILLWDMAILAYGPRRSVFEPVFNHAPMFFFHLFIGFVFHLAGFIPASEVENRNKL